MALGGLVLTGAHVLLYINGRQVGRVTSFVWSPRRTVRRIQGIDTLLASELAPGPVSVSGQIGLIRTRRDGGAEGAGLMAPPPDLTREQYVSLLLKDRIADTVIFRADQCMVDSQSWRSETKNIISGTVTFEGISAFNEVLARGAG